MRLPYFDALLEGRPPEAAPFSLSVHAGLWDAPPPAPAGPGGLREAMARLDARVLDAAALADGQVVCDAGCGLGGTLAAVDARGRGMTLTGVNLDARQLAVARAHVRPGGANRLDFVEGDACALPFADGALDRLLAVECVFHFRSRAAFLREAARVLCPGGRLTLTDFVPGPRPVDGRTLERLLEPGWGRVSAEIPSGGYAALAAEAGLCATRDEDLTAATLPTYPAMLALLGRGEGRAGLRRSARALELLCRTRRLSYRLLALDKTA